MQKHTYQSYSAATGVWDPDELGNHRAVVEVAPGGTGDAVGVRILWRRRDSSPESKGLLVYSRTGVRIEDYVPVVVNQSFGEIIFNPIDGPGRYYIYFMPYTGTVKKPYPEVTYLPSDLEPSEWRSRNAHVTLADVPSAAVLALESVDEFNRFTDMELTPTPDERALLHEKYAGRGLIVFPESRTSPIRMFDSVPAKWAIAGPAEELREAARPGEFFVYQLGVYAPSRDTGTLSVHFSALESSNGGRISADWMTCFNTQGIGWDGAAFQKAISVAPGRVQPIWCGVDLPEDVPPGTYVGTVRVSGVDDEWSCRIALAVDGPAIPRHGDDDPWRLSRLRWLNSTLGTANTVVPPFEPVVRNSREITVLGRVIRLSDSGLPADITSNFSDDVQSTDGDGLSILSRPVEFVVDSGAASFAMKAESLEFTEENESTVSWCAVSRAGELRFEVHGSLDFDGTLEYQVAVTAGVATEVSDIRMEVAVPDAVAQFMTGLGRKGGFVPDEFSWRWSAERNQDSFWIGSVNGGLQVTLKDDCYSRPLNTNFYHLKPLVMPASWDNDGRGGISLGRSGDEYRITCTSGPRSIQESETLHYDVRIAVTPFKPIDTRRHFGTRYYHAYSPLEEVVESGGNTVNIHHASFINPFINYPFLSADVLGRYISDAHDRDLKVKLYYTVREITTRAPELFMLKSLDSEILVDGAGGGHGWLQEHFADSYIAAWYALPVRDTSVINGILSRWHNFYVEGMNWLAENLAIDGVYIDDLGFGREIMKRVRRVLHRHRGDPQIDLHSANQYNERDGYASSANLYLEHFPYLDRLWFGEYFDYDERPDYWLVEISGIPFGLMGEMLQDGGNLFRGMIFGATGRMPRVPTNSALWKFWDEFGLPDAKMIGFWSSGSPVTASHDDVFTTVYRGTTTTVIAVASWADGDVQTDLSIDWQGLGLEEDAARIRIPAIEGIQSDGGTLEHPILTVPQGGGVLLVVEGNR